MSCARHRWSEIGHVGPTISVECSECGSVAVVDRLGAVLDGPHLQATLWPTARYEQLAMTL
jgi:hypothetical protein